jgi:hypothetical protein
MTLERAVQEAVTPFVALQRKRRQHLQCSVGCDRSVDVVITVRERGNGFDHTAVPNPLVPSNI